MCARVYADMYRNAVLTLVDGKANCGGKNSVGSVADNSVSGNVNYSQSNAPQESVNENVKCLFLRPINDLFALWLPR